MKFPELVISWLSFLGIAFTACLCRLAIFLRFELVTCEFELVTHGFELVTHKVELANREFELVYLKP